LYIGGGFPETHAARLADNRTLRESVRCAAVRGLPIYAECGGLVYLAESLVIDETCFPLAGVFPVRVALDKKPQGHGYVRLTVDGENPYFPIGTVVNAHEFHYTHIVSGDDRARTVCALEFGKGCFRKRDGLVLNRTMATYAHLHALGVPQWAPALVRLAGQYQHERAGNIREEARGHCAVSGVG
jgi:cobyrinic acid a,c-diamide synthase